MSSALSSRWQRGVPSRLERLRNERYNRSWISKFAFKNTEFMPIEESISGPESGDDRNPHQLVWLRNVQYAINVAKRYDDIKSYTFLDLGCGTGVPSIFALIRCGFLAAEGFDIDSRFVKWARENAELTDVREGICFFQADATKVRLKDKKYFIFFFNSFGSETLGVFLDKNRAVLRRRNSMLCLVNDWAAPEVFKREDTTLLFRNSRKNTSLFKFS